MKEIGMNQALKLIIVTSIFMVASSLYYYLVIHLPERNGAVSDQQQEQLIKENKEIADNLFEKNIKCEKYKEEIIEKISLYNNSRKPEVRNGNNDDTSAPDYHSYIEEKEFEEIFYSPEVNSCLYLESQRTLMKIDSDLVSTDGQWMTVHEYYNLIDILSDKEIESVRTMWRGEQFDSYDSVQNLVDKYRGI